MQQSPAEFSRPGGDRRACLLVFPVSKAGTVFGRPPNNPAVTAEKLKIVARVSCLEPWSSRPRPNGQLNAYDMLG